MRTVTTTKVAGSTFSNRQGFICYLQKNKEKAFVTVQRERNNKFDPNAIRVIGHVRGGKHVDLGYLPKELASKVAPIMDAGNKPWVESFVVRCGGPKKTYGVTIEIKY